MNRNNHPSIVKIGYIIVPRDHQWTDGVPAGTMYADYAAADEVLPLADQGRKIVELLVRDCREETRIARTYRERLADRLPFLERIDCKVLDAGPWPNIRVQVQVPGMAEPVQISEWGGVELKDDRQAQWDAAVDRWLASDPKQQRLAAAYLDMMDRHDRARHAARVAEVEEFNERNEHQISPIDPFVPAVRRPCPYTMWSMREAAREGRTTLHLELHMMDLPASVLADWGPAVDKDPADRA